MAAAGENSRAQGTMTGGERVRSHKPAGTPGKALRWRLRRASSQEDLQETLRSGTSDMEYLSVMRGAVLPRSKLSVFQIIRPFPAIRWNQIG